MGYFAGWIGWVVILPYLAQKPSLIIVAFNWMVNQNGDISSIDPMTVQLIGVVIFLVCVFLASRGIKVVKTIASIAGTGSFIMAMLFIVFGLLAPIFNVNPSEVPTYSLNLDPTSFVPTDMSVFASLSILLFGVGGAEKIAPYVNRMEKPGRDFPKGIIAVVIMVAVAAFAGAIAMGLMFGQDCQGMIADPNNLDPNKTYTPMQIVANGETTTVLMDPNFITNGQYVCFQKVGQAFGLGNVLMVLYAAIKLITDAAVLIVSIDVPLRLLLEDSDQRFIPKGSLKKNKYGAYPYWLLVVTIITVFLLVVPTLSMGTADDLIKWLLEICSIVMPIFYICVFVAYIALKVDKKKVKKHKDDFIFIKNKGLGIFVGLWCAVITFAGMVMKMQNDDPAKFIMNVAIPIVLIAMGLILPLIAKAYNNKKGVKTK